MMNIAFFHFTGRGVRALLATVTVFVVLLGAGLQSAWAGIDVRVVKNAQNRIVLKYELGDFSVKRVSIEGSKYAEIVLPKESLRKVEGAPELPYVSRSLIIPDNAEMAVHVLEANHYEVNDISVAPSKGFLLRTVNPAEIPYMFGPVYKTDDFYPSGLSSLRQPYILRDHRGIVVEINPFQYNPVKRVLRVYNKIVLEVVAIRPGQVNVLKRLPIRSRPSLAFETIYRNHFVNYRATPRPAGAFNEAGDLLIIAHDPWIPNLKPLIDQRMSKGIRTTAIGVSTIGNDPDKIKAYIQNVYNKGGLAYVLLVGDGQQVRSPEASGGSADPTYALLAGNDTYPDILVGRFSAETAADVDTQVQRTVEYEQLRAPTLDWFKRGIGIGSDQGEGSGDNGEADFQHIGKIRSAMLARGYTLVDEVYDPSASAAKVSSAINEGRGVINYCGHGSATSWGTTGFDSGDVSALNNEGKLPFIFSVACVNGQFDGGTCFAETWLRARQGSAPTGAIAAYMSSINQSWAPPMSAQDKFADLLLSEANVSFGALAFGASCKMMDDYADKGAEMYDTWHVFGDPSVRVVMTCSEAGTISLDRKKYAGESLAGIKVTDCGLDIDHGVVDSATIRVSSTSDPVGKSVLLKETGPSGGEFTGAIKFSTLVASDALLVAQGDTITATYIDANNGQGGSNVAVMSTAVVDVNPPVIQNVKAVNIQARSASVTFDSNEPATGQVIYGTSCEMLSGAATSPGYETAVKVDLTNLKNGTTYFYAAVAADEAGNMIQDTNGGACYRFTTPKLPDYFTQMFKANNDLNNISLRFTPTGNGDFYAGCTRAITALPIDPSGGKVLNLSDDFSVQVNLGSDATISLYGKTYSSFFVGSNGYITFPEGDQSYEPTLEAHFKVPRISGFFADLNPASAGSVSWKQLADRAVVTWDNVPAYGSSKANTFQVEMHYDGTIVVSYLSLGATGGLAGLSAGNGLDASFYETDLSAMGSCGK